MTQRLRINNHVSIPEYEIVMTAIRAQGAGGQNVNKVSTAIQLHFDVRKSSLPARYKTAIQNYADKRISKDGIITIKAQRYRSQAQNREDALQRLQALLKAAVQKKKKRIPTRIPKGEKRRRLEAKQRKGQTKALRRKPPMTQE